jgi:hypothetical protein
VRDVVVGPDEPIHKGRIAYRAVFPAELMGGFDIGPSRTKWWGTDRHIIIYYTTKAKSEVYFVTRMPEPAEWLTRESWSAKGDVEELRAAYEGFYQDVCNVLEACSDCHKWAILEREPLPRWSDGRVVLLGDAAHPMTPYMAQGAATSIEDAAILARCLDAVKGEDIEGPSNVTRLTANGAHRLCRRSPARTPGCGTSAAATRAGFMATMPGARTSISLLRTRKCRQHDQRRTGGNVEAFVGDGMRLTRCNNYHDFRGLARRRLPGPIFNYIDGAAEDETTYQRNTLAFGECDLVPNVLAGVAQVDLSVIVMGHKLAMPFYCSPTALQRLFHHQGERAVARAVEKFGTMFGVSSLGTVSLEEI